MEGQFRIPMDLYGRYLARSHAHMAALSSSEALLLKKEGKKARNTWEMPLRRGGGQAGNMRVRYR